MSEYESVRKVLSNLRSLRAMARETDFETLEDMAAKLNSVVEDLREDAQREAQEREKRDQKKRELLDLILQEGFSVDELVGQGGATTARKQRKKREPSKARYQYQKDGETHFWTGQGRKPLPIQEALNAGGSLEDFLIEDGAKSE